MYGCIILKDSITYSKHRLTTFEITYPRIIHSEMCRHRAFSRNTASSRAIPFSKTKSVLDNNTFVPIAWQKKHKGMQGYLYFSKEESDKLTAIWLNAKDNIMSTAEQLDALALTKQLVNRLVEPFTWTTEIVTVSSNGLFNFFNLRCPQYESINEDGSKIYSYSKKSYYRLFPEKMGTMSDEDFMLINKSLAEIHIQKIAELMFDDFTDSEPTLLAMGEYHIPYSLSELEKKEYNIKHEDAIKIAIARCARLSYATLGDSPKVDFNADLSLYYQLLKDSHMSPFEHVARVMTASEYVIFSGKCNNFEGFIQQRFIVENEKI